MGLTELAQQLGIADLVRFVPPVDRSTLAQWYRAADLVARALAQRVLRAGRGGGPGVRHTRRGRQRRRPAHGRRSCGVLVDGHDTADWATALEAVLRDPRGAAALARTSVEHAAGFSWARTAGRLAEVYADAMDHPREVPIHDAELLTGIPTAVIP
jgi:D-inositol-3-phosphate glycosyltransferase